MCGISGKVYFGKREVNLNDLKRMTSILSHRGPDDTGHYISKEKYFGFGSNRLAIIDLSPKGHQPMIYKDRYVITFNGEIYNYQEQREKLLKEGYKFNSTSDTEVILALYSKYGTGFLKYLRGMFAFAIYDLKEDTIFLARDRIGKRPLKYFLNDDVFIFASELKAILTQPDVKKEIDYKAIRLYLTYGYVPAPLTGFVGIKKLEPGSYIFINRKRKTFEKKRYWQPDFSEKLQLSEKEWCDRILDTLEDSTKIRMLASDVEVGAFLSGGVDSSGVVATMAGLSKKPIKTFTITFQDKTMDEGPYAKNIAKMYKTDHHELLAKPASIEILPKVAYQFEEPFADGSAVVSMMVSEMASKYIKVVLNGDGGDENFGGYPNRYFRLKRDVTYDKWIQEVRPYAAKVLRDLLKSKKNRGVNKLRNFFDKAELPLYERFASYNQIFKRQEILANSEGILKEIPGEQSLEIVKECFLMFKGNDIKDAGLKFDLLYFLPDQLLTKMDIATMAYGLEGRSPLLDQEMVELACKIPFDLKLKNNETKYILKKAMERIIPKENIYRPKRGFTIPLDKWFSGELNEYASSVLLSKKSNIKSIFNENYIESMLLDRNKTEDYGPRIWSLLLLELWSREYFN